MGTGSTGSQDRPAVDVALLVARVIVGIIFAAHGALKLFGAFGGPGLAAMVQPPPNGMGLLGYPVTIGEFFGAVDSRWMFIRASICTGSCGRMPPSTRPTSQIYCVLVTIKSTTGVGSCGPTGKCPSPGFTITVIWPPNSL
jgi:hypothetical protein